MSYVDLDLTDEELTAALTPSHDGLRFATFGHSLVSQVQWQKYVRSALGAEGYTFYGISGGSIQPKPGEGTSGMFSRAHWTTVAASAVNTNDADAGGANSVGFTGGALDRTVFTILWAGANDAICDYTNSYNTLYLRHEFIETLLAKAADLTSGAYADTTAGLAATSADEYFDTASAVSGWRLLYKNHLGAARLVYYYPEAGTTWTCDRSMTVAEQDEFEARNTADGSAAFLSEPLSTGYVVTYEGLWQTLIRNYYTQFNLHERADHKLFIVREPQAFWVYDGTMGWPEGLRAKQDVHERVAERMGCPLIDLWGASGISVFNRGIYLQVESSGDLMIHLNDTGGRLCGKVVAAAVEMHSPVDYTGATGATVLDDPATVADFTPWDEDSVIVAGA